MDRKYFSAIFLNKDIPNITKLTLAFLRPKSVSPFFFTATLLPPVLIKPAYFFPNITHSFPTLPKKMLIQPSTYLVF